MNVIETNVRIAQIVLLLRGGLTDYLTAHDVKDGYCPDANADDWQEYLDKVVSASDVTMEYYELALELAQLVGDQ